jgi:cell division septation protein DedD
VGSPKEAVKDSRERSAEISRADSRPPPASLAVAETPEREASSLKKKVTETAPTIVAKGAPSVPLARETKQEQPAEKKVEQLALKKPPTVPQLEKPKPKVLRGYIVQFSFADRAEAERWFSLLNQEGYVTSISLSGEGRPVRLRVGNFPSPVEAKNALVRFQKKGLTGLVVQLPN